MKRVKRLARSLEVARDRELRGLRSVQLLQEDIERRKQSLEQLQQYGDEYRLVLSSGAGSRISSRNLTQTGAFLANLEAAIEQQSGQIGKLREAYQQHQRYWVQQRSKRAALDKYVGRLQKEVDRSRQRSEQRAMDDYPRLIKGIDRGD